MILISKVNGQNKTNIYYLNDFRNNLISEIFKINVNFNNVNYIITETCIFVKFEKKFVFINFNTNIKKEKESKNILNEYNDMNNPMINYMLNYINDFMIMLMINFMNNFIFNFVKNFMNIFMDINIMMDPYMNIIMRFNRMINHIINLMNNLTINSNNMNRIEKNNPINYFMKYGFF